MTFEHLAAKSFWWRGAWDDNSFYSMTADERRAWRDRPVEPPQQVLLVELTHENSRDYGRLHTHRSQERFVATTMEQSYADALFPQPQDGHPILPELRGIEAERAAGHVEVRSSCVWGTKRPGGPPAVPT